MEDIVLTAKIDDLTTLYVAPIVAATYAEYVDGDNLGGEDGYFLMRSQGCEGAARFEILAKASSFDAASELFDLIVGRRPSAF